MSEVFRVSVLVRTRDIEDYFSEFLWKLSGQSLRPSELVIVDNFSSKEKLREMNSLLLRVKREFFGDQIQVKLVPLTDREFSHAYSTNVGVFVADGDLVCITNGHSLPLSNKWLGAGVSHFKDCRVVGVAGYFIPHKDGSVWEKLAYDFGWKRLNNSSKAYLKDDFFSTVNCVLRRSSWEEYPFDEKLPDRIPDAREFGGEDYDWALEMLARGYNMIVAPNFNVHHSHKERLPQLVSKYIIWRRIRKRIRGLKRPRTPYTKLESVKPLYYNL